MGKKMDLYGRTAIVTGSASGIGRAVAISLAKRGCNLAIADVNDTGLAETATLIGDRVRISRHHLDVGDAAAIKAFPAEVLAEHEGVDILVNNAGVGVGGTFEQASEDDFEWLIDINFYGVVRMTRAFMPLLRKSDDARIVNISSIFGIIAPPEETAYCASKFAVKGFSESLRNELTGSKIGVTVVHPGGVRTSIAENARMPSDVPQAEIDRRMAIFRKLLRLPPEVAGETIVQGIENRRDRILVGSDAKAMSLIARLFPVSYWKVLTWKGPLRKATKQLEKASS
ncbi:MAG TPA: SDR family oxidoreductase [Pyrinomonadaceae bacterium]|nr:SDR family oxidoreductase [Pyrinomonadaceae bacterium]